MALIGLAGLARSTPAPIAETPIASAPIVVHGPVDVNTATAGELATLPRIGPTLAARIVEDRDTRGPFATLDALDRVPGLGPGTIAELRDHAIAGPALSTE